MTAPLHSLEAHIVTVDQRVLDQLFGFLIGRGYMVDTTLNGVTVRGTSGPQKNTRHKEPTQFRKGNLRYRPYLVRANCPTRLWFAIVRGRRVGVYHTWANAKKELYDSDGNVTIGARYAGFSTEKAAMRYLHAEIEKGKAARLADGYTISPVLRKEDMEESDSDESEIGDIIEVDRKGNPVETSNA